MEYNLAMKTFITGGAGFIGSHLAEYLLSLGQQVVILDNFNEIDNGNLRQPNRSNNFKIIKGSILDQDLVSELMKGVTHCYQPNSIKSGGNFGSKNFTCFKL
jgi:UDP-glucose 4-epimerase